MYLHALGLLMVALTTRSIPLITRVKFQLRIHMKKVYIHIIMIRPFMDIVRSILGRLKMAETWVSLFTDKDPSQRQIWIIFFLLIE